MRQEIHTVSFNPKFCACQMKVSNGIGGNNCWQFFFRENNHVNKRTDLFWATFNHSMGNNQPRDMRKGMETSFKTHVDVFQVSWSGMLLFWAVMKDLSNKNFGNYVLVHWMFHLHRPSCSMNYILILDSSAHSLHQKSFREHIFSFQFEDWRLRNINGTEQQFFWSGKLPWHQGIKGDRHRASVADSVSVGITGISAKIFLYSG